MSSFCLLQVAVARLARLLIYVKISEFDCNIFDTVHVKVCEFDCDKLVCLSQFCMIVRGNCTCISAGLENEN